MNQRLMWNFEISSRATELSLQDQSGSQVTGTHWEKRYFWSQSTIVLLMGKNEHLFHLSHYTFKQKTDTYWLFPKKLLNIKERKNRLLFKPLLASENQCFSYSKKLDLEQNLFSANLPSFLQQGPSIRQYIYENAKKITVEKETAGLIIQKNPSVKIEFARLNILKKTYFSACIESKNRRLVESVATHLFPNDVGTHYITFLEEFIND